MSSNTFSRTISWQLPYTKVFTIVITADNRRRSEKIRINYFKGDWELGPETRVVPTQPQNPDFPAWLNYGLSSTLIPRRVLATYLSAIKCASEYLDNPQKT